MSLHVIGRALVLTGVIFIILGVIFVVSGKIPFLGRLPGDILIKKKNYTIYFPLITSILLSIVLSAIFIIVNYFRK